jgi:hypothetical protein
VLPQPIAPRTPTCCMPPTARERALALISALDPNDLVPCRILADLLAEEDPAHIQIGGPPHPDGWTTKALAAHYECGVSTMRGRIEGGEFGMPETPGGPRKSRRRGWLVPHHQVLARDERVHGEARGANVLTPIAVSIGPTAPTPTESPSGARPRDPAPSAGGRGGLATPSLKDARRRRETKIAS